MSRAYRIKIQDGIQRKLTASDEVCSELELLEILPAEQMRGLLSDELRKRGFAEEADGVLSRAKNAIRVTVDTKTGEVKVTSSQDKSVDIQSEREALGFDDLGPSKEEIKNRLKAEVAKSLESQAQKHEEQLRAKATEKLDGALGAVSKELGEIVNGVTRDALKRKAASLGRITELSENPEAGTLSIKVEV